jgi:hypothetical protein
MKFKSGKQERRKEESEFSFEEILETKKPGKWNIRLADIRKKNNQESRKLGNENQKTSCRKSQYLSCFPGFLIH